uniref:Putative secreted protein n=1 Tax=Amblyomma parvum TaxID=251391 RepID=A0A023FZB0_AMBPA
MQMVSPAVILWGSLMFFHSTLAITEQPDSGEYEESGEYEYSDEEENCTESRIKPLCLSVMRFGNITVTNATYGNNETVYHSQLTGNWSGHSMCLMPCNPLHPLPCESLEGGNCTCIPRNDYPSVGVCAMANVCLGNDDYNTTGLYVSSK